MYVAVTGIEELSADIALIAFAPFSFFISVAVFFPFTAIISFLNAKSNCFFNVAVRLPLNGSVDFNTSTIGCCTAVFEYHNVFVVFNPVPSNVIFTVSFTLVFGITT